MFYWNIKVLAIRQIIAIIINIYIALSFLEITQSTVTHRMFACRKLHHYIIWHMLLVNIGRQGVN